MRRSRVCIVWGLCLVTLVAAGMAGAGRPSASERAPSLASATPHTAPPPAGLSAADQPTSETAGLRAYGQLPLSFEANHGQSATPVQFLSRGRGYTLFLTPTEAVLVLRPPRPVRASPTSHAPDLEAMPRETVVRMRLVGAHPAPQVVGQDALPGKAHYLTGPAPNWRTQIPTYARVRYHEVYAGIDLVYYGNQRQLEYDFVLAPGADPTTIRLAFQGVDSLEVDAQGNLVLHTPGGIIHQLKPRIYQEVEGVRQEIPGEYVLKNTDQVGVHVAAYDATRPLVIDPVLAYSTYLGGSGSGTESSNAIAVDAAGSAYVTGFTASADFPTTLEAFRPTPVGSQDAFVAKLNPAGTELVYSTYLGGSGNDGGTAIAVDAAGNAYVTGVTSSDNFPTTDGAFRTTRVGSQDAFVAKLNPLGTAPLLYSTYLGGSNTDVSTAIAVDTVGNAYVTGVTISNNFPTTDGAFQPTPVAQEDAFVTKLNPLGTAPLLYSTYLGGRRDERGNGIAVDTAGNAYVTGVTTSTDFPTTDGAFQPTPLGVPDAFVATPPDVLAAGSPMQDAFVAKLNATGSDLDYSTYLSGTNADSGTAIAVDAAGNAYVTGVTASANFPKTTGAFQTMLVGPQDAFVTKLNPTGSAPLLYSTYLGGAGDESGNGIAVDATGNAYVTGDTASANFPTTDGAFQTTRKGKGDAFVTTLNTTGSALLYSTYLGGVDQGAGRESGNGIAVDTACNIYVTGVTRSDDFPTFAPPPPPGAFQPDSGGGGDDGFVTKIGAEACPPVRISLQKEVVDTDVTLPPPPYTIGGQVTYRYTLRNESNVTLMNPRVVDRVVVDGVEVKVMEFTCGSFTGTPATAVCTSTYTIDSAHVDPSSMLLTNIATGFATVEPDGPELSASDTFSQPVVVAGQLGISKSATPNPVLAGKEITYTLTAINATTTDAANVLVRDLILANTTFVRAIVPDTPPGWTFRLVTDGNPAMSEFFHPALPAQSASTLILVVRVNEGVPPGTVIRNEACITIGRPPGCPPEASASKEVLVRAPRVDLAVTKRNVGNSVPRGSVTTYVVEVSNLGEVPVKGVTVSDPLASGFSVLTWECIFADAGSRCLTPSGTGNLNTSVDLGVGGTVVFEVRAEVSLTAGDSVTDTVTVTAPPGVTEDSLVNNTASDTDTVLPAADIAVRKTVDNATPVVGQTVTFTVTATNNGPNPATGVKLSDGVPAGLALVSATPSQGTYASDTGVWDIGALAMGAQTTLTLVVQVQQAGLILNVAEKIAGDQFDPKTSNDRSGVGITNEPVADIQIHKTADTVVVPVGNDVTFTVTVTNAGPSAASGVELTDLLPEGLVLVSATPAQGTYTPTTGVWAIGTLAVNAPTTLTLRATVQQTGALTNRAAKTAQGELDPNPGNDVSGVTVNGVAADVQVVKTVDRAMPNVGDTVTFTVTVTNNGPSVASGVEVLEVLSARLTFVSATPSQGDYTAATGLWEVGTLASTGPAATATLQVRATVTQAGPLTNLAVKIAQDEPDPNPANDQDIIAPPGQPLADLVLTKSNGASSLVPGTEVIYTVVVTNRGPSAVTGATVRDPNPLIFVDPSRRLESFEALAWTCVASEGSTCPGGGAGDVLAPVDLLVGGTATFTIRGRVAPAGRGTLVNAATVRAPAEVLDPLLGNNITTDTDRLTPIADLSITKTDEVQSVVPGTAVRYTLVVRNAGPSALISALVQDPTSAALTGVRWTCVASAGSSCQAEGTGPIDTTVNLAPGGTATFTLTGTVAVEATGTLTNTATVTPSPGVIDPDLRNNTTTDTNAVLPLPVFGPPAGRKTVQVGELPTLEWRVVWLNNGNAVPLRARLLDPIPAATTYVDGSVTCVPSGLSTVARCDFDAATNQLVYDGTLGADLGATTEAQAANEVVITFRTTVLPGATQVANQALAHWDANGNGTVDDDISAGQVPVRTGTVFGQNDVTVATFPGLACLFQQRLLLLASTGPTAGGSVDTDPDEGQDPAVDEGVDRQSASGADSVFTLSTPLDSDRVAGTTVTLAALQVPVSGSVVSQPAEILIANGTAADTLDIVENVGNKTERLPAGEAHDVVTADGVVVELPATGLAAADTLRLERVAPTTAPAPLPGVAVRPLVALTLTSGRATFSSPVTLSLPYPDADQDGLVDAISPALPELALTAWVFDAARGRWVRLPEARVFTAFNELRVATTQTGLYGVFQATDGSTGLAGSSGLAAPGPRSAAAQGLGWQDIGVVTTFPFLVPLNTTTLPNGTYAVRTVCTTNPAELRAVAASAPTTATALRTSGGDGGGCTLQPGAAWSRSTALAALGNLGVPLVALLLLGLWVWRRPR